MTNGVWLFVDVATAGEPAWAAAAVASSSVMQDDRHNDRSHLVRQVIVLYVFYTYSLFSFTYILCNK